MERRSPTEVAGQRRQHTKAAIGVAPFRIALVAGGGVASVIGISGRVSAPL
jgi:hypothetical protein